MLVQMLMTTCGILIQKRIIAIHNARWALSRGIIHCVGLIVFDMVMDATDNSDASVLVVVKIVTQNF